MARKYDFTTAGTKVLYGWGMERCEERLLWAGWAEIEAHVPPDQTTRKEEFLDKFLNQGLGVTFDTLAWINSLRRRRGLAALEFKETTIYEYGRMTDRTQKSELRRQMKQDYFLLDTAGRERWKRESEAETAKLLPPHHTHAEIVARRMTPQPSLTPKERAVRLQVVDQRVAVQEPEPEPPQYNPVVVRALRQLRLAKKPETLARIIAQLAPDDALDIAESGEVQDDDLIDELVSRSLEEVA